MQQNTKNIVKGINLGKENGLSLLLDAEVYDYAFSPQKGRNVVQKIFDDGHIINVTFQQKNPTSLLSLIWLF